MEPINDNSNNNNDNTQVEDKILKKKLLLSTIATECKSSSHIDLQQINKAINNGSKLDATVLSGGYTNYSYKVFIVDKPELVVFAKLCFEFALWNPDKDAHYDLQRTTNEYEIMVTMSKLAPNSIVNPILLSDIEHEGQSMKLLVTEWSCADEQFCNQFIDGSVDPRIAPKLANTLASLHLIKDFDPSFNERVKPCMESLLENTMKKSAMEASKLDNPNDRTEVYCTSLGEEVMLKIMNASIADYHKRDCLIHADSHVFNTLVEAKPSIEHLERFGPDGTMVLVDWEMAMAGSIGQDVGKGLAFPIGCLISHAMSGHMEANDSIQAHINILIDTYFSRLKEAGKTEDELASILKIIAGWCGWFQYIAFYLFRDDPHNSQVHNFPVEVVNKAHLCDSIGVLSLKLMRLAYDDDYITESASLEEVRKVFDHLIEDEVTRAQYVFASGTNKRQPRKSSMLRAANRRLSDTEMLFLAAESMKRLSITENIKRVSISEGSENSAELLQ